MNRLSVPKRQRCPSSNISSSKFLLLMKSVTWFFHDCCGLFFLAYHAMSTVKSSSVIGYLPI